MKEQLYIKAINKVLSENLKAGRIDMISTNITNLVNEICNLVQPIEQSEVTAESVIRSICKYSNEGELNPSDDITISEALEAMEEYTAIKSQSLPKERVNTLLPNEKIYCYQEWIENSDEKTGWKGLGWNEPDGFQIEKVLDEDKYGHPIKAIFKKQSLPKESFRLSDEEIENWAKSIRIDFGTEILIRGAKWYRDQVQINLRQIFRDFCFELKAHYQSMLVAGDLTPDDYEKFIDEYFKNK